MNNIKIDINTSNNLLAFSAGVDSTALFFLMLEKNIPFDIAIVNYNQREQSKDEIIYATQLAHKYKKKCFISEYPSTKKFSEKEARDYRHNFFEEIINKDKYESLITAHQLNDKLEWFLMQLTKGAGLVELVGMQKVSILPNYQLHKPLLDISKQTLLQFLDQNQIKYFFDQSNLDEKYKRNYFRHNFSDSLISEYEEGIAKSFKYLENDYESLLSNIEVVKHNELNIYTYNKDMNIGLRIIDRDLKMRGIIISHGTREEVRKKKEIVISHKISVAICEDKIYVSPFIKETMDKKFKEKCRLHEIPKNIRSYIFSLYKKDLFTF